MPSSKRSRGGEEEDEHAYPYDYITLPCGDRFDIPDGDDREEWVEFFAEATRATAEINARCGDGLPPDGINRACVLPGSTHRDGALYAGATRGWRHEYRISDAGETQLDTSALSNQNACYPDEQKCFIHRKYGMMQIFSLKLGKISSVDTGPVQIYGYMAARDTLDPLRNYVFNRSRDDPITLEQGSFMEMTGPKRGIEMMNGVLIEYDMRMKKGAEEADDVQLIDGVIDFCEITTPTRPFLSRIDGAGGAVDVTLAMVCYAVEATVHVDVSRVGEGGFSLVLTSLLGGRDQEEIQLFHGVVSRPCALRRFVIAVETWMHLKFMVGGGRGGLTDGVEGRASFKAKHYGCDTQLIELDEASFTVKVTWATYRGCPSSSSSGKCA